MANDKDKIKEYIRNRYDEEAEQYGLEFRTPVGKYFMYKKIKLALELGNFKKGDNILEAACANGIYTFELKRFGFKSEGTLRQSCFKDGGYGDSQIIAVLKEEWVRLNDTLMKSE